MEYFSLCMRDALVRDTCELVGFLAEQELAAEYSAHTAADEFATFHETNKRVMQSKPSRMPDDAETWPLNIYRID